jgi:hypothetical protein
MGNIELHQVDLLSEHIPTNFDQPVYRLFWQVSTDKPP